MPEEINKPSPEKQRYKDFYEAYKNLTGHEFPNSPKDMPNEIDLPNTAIGNIFEALSDMENTDHRYSQGGITRERSQAIGLFNRDGSLHNDKVIIGDHQSTGVGDVMSQIGRWFRPLAGHDSKPVTWWHIHSQRKTNVWKGYVYHIAGGFLSTADAAQRIGEDRKAAIYLLGAPDGIRAVFQTKEAVRKRIPLSTWAIISKEYDEIYKRYDSGHLVPDESALSEYFESKGYVLYGWKKKEPEDTVLKAYDRGEFMNGIHLNRIGQPLWLRKLTGEA